MFTQTQSLRSLYPLSIFLRNWKEALLYMLAFNMLQEIMWPLWMWTYKIRQGLLIEMKQKLDQQSVWTVSEPIGWPVMGTTDSFFLCWMFYKLINKISQVKWSTDAWFPFDASSDGRSRFSNYLSIIDFLKDFCLGWIWDWVFRV